MISALESLLFLVGDEGLTESKLIDIFEIDELSLQSLIEKLSTECSNNNRGIELVKFGNRYKFVTKKENLEYIKKLMTLEDNDTLSDSSLEVLAIIAYNQPVTRSMVDEIRGVSSSYAIRKLQYKNLIHEMGRSETAGRPVLYGTTTLFLDHFGLQNISELPNMTVTKSDSEVDLYNSKYTEEI